MAGNWGSGRGATAKQVMREATFRAGFADAREGRAFAVDDYEFDGEQWGVRARLAFREPVPVNSSPRLNRRAAPP
jgi:hypothetical protein